MGQYRQWLHYREIDQLLRSQLAVSEHELEQLQAQVELLGKQNFSMENSIFQALMKPQQNKWNHREEPTIQYEEEFTKEEEEQEGQREEIVIEEVEEEDTAIISPALLAWSRLPNFDTQMIQEPEVSNPAKIPEPLPPQPPEHLLPTDISAFLDAHYSINPQTRIPWWLHNIALPDQEVQETYAIDQPGERVDHLVQRWFERWGQQSMKTKRSQEEQKP